MTSFLHALPQRLNGFFRPSQGPAYISLDALDEISTRSKSKQTFPLLLRFSLPALLVGFIVGLYLSSRKAPVQTGPEIADQPPPYFEPALNRFLTDRQCQDTFPGLDKEASRAADYWLARGGITHSHLQDALRVADDQACRFKIIANRLYVVSTPSDNPSGRQLSTMAMINEAVITSNEKLPDVEFVTDTWDAGRTGGPSLGLCRRPNEEDLFVMPDFGFGTWPETRVMSFITVRDRAEQRDKNLSWKDKTPKLFFRGAAWVNRVRDSLLQIAQQHPEWGSDVTDLNWQEGKDRVMRMDEHCNWRFLAHAEGTAYSGRLKYLLQCRSIVIAHPLNYIQHYTHLINTESGSTYQNMIVTPEPDFGGLPEIMDRLLADEAGSERLANQSHTFWRHWLSPASTNCAWRGLIREYGKAQAFVPKLDDNDVDYASFEIMRRTRWEPF